MNSNQDDEIKMRKTEALELINNTFSQQDFFMVGFEGCLEMMISQLQEYKNILEEEIQDPTSPEDLKIDLEEDWDLFEEDELDLEIDFEEMEHETNSNPSLPTKEQLQEDLEEIEESLTKWIKVKALHDQDLL